MSQAENQPVATTDKKKKRHGVLIPALRLGAALALLNTFIDAVRIWGQAPSAAYLKSSGTGAAGAGLLAYRFSTLLGAAITNFIMWFVAALIMLFVLSQFKKV